MRTQNSISFGWSVVIPIIQHWYGAYLNGVMDPSEQATLQSENSNPMWFCRSANEAFTITSRLPISFFWTISHPSQTSKKPSKHRQIQISQKFSFVFSVQFLQQQFFLFSCLLFETFNTHVEGLKLTIPTIQWNPFGAKMLLMSPFIIKCAFTSMSVAIHQGAFLD